MMLRSATLRSARAQLLSPRRLFGSTSSLNEEYDLTVIGGGPGGYVAAIKAAQLGLKTICVESRGRLGGTCLNVGCIPSKALLHSSHLFHEAQHDFEKYGIKADGVSYDFDKLMGYKTSQVEGLTQGIEGLFKKYKVDYSRGHGKIVGANTVSVALNEGGNETINTKNIMIATGSEVTPLPPCPVDNEGGRIIDSTGALSLKKVPEHMVVVGGGVIGLEMGSVYKRLGSKVTVVEFMDRLCPAMDKEITKTFQRLLKRQGFDFKMSTKVMGSSVEGDEVKLTLQPAAGGEDEVLVADTVLVSTGRRPFTQGLGLEEMGIQMDRMGRVQVDEHFRTQVPNIYAIGDCIEGQMLAHKAEEEGIACVESLAGMHGHVNYDVIPGVVYTFPEVATVGKTEEELKEEGVAYNKGSFPFLANSRARCNGTTEGTIKVLADKTTDRLLGVHIIGPNAGEMIGEAVLGMEYGASSEDIARTCHAHPTLSEALKEACMATYDKPIHF